MAPVATVEPPPAAAGESTVLNCEPLPSPDAYHATRSHTASAGEPGSTTARASYHEPALTITA